MVKFVVNSWVSNNGDSISAASYSTSRLQPSSMKMEYAATQKVCDDGFDIGRKMLITQSTYKINNHNRNKSPSRKLR